MKSKANKQWTTRDINTLLRMSSAGESNIDIATALGRTEKGVVMQMYNMRRALKMSKGGNPRQTDLSINKPKPVVKPKPVREVPNKPTVKPKQLMKRQGWWSRLRHGDKSLEARVVDLEAEVRGIHIALNKLLSELGEDRC